MIIFAYRCRAEPLAKLSHRDRSRVTDAARFAPQGTNYRACLARVVLLNTGKGVRTAFYRLEPGAMGVAAARRIRI